MDAMQAQTVDVIKRMKEITLVMQTPNQVLESQGVTPADLEDMLEELQEHVESIDMANDLHSIGGLLPLLGYLKNSHANIRAKAADVVTTIVQNNPRSQQLIMEANGLESLLANFTSDPDITVRTKALGAISSLIRHNKPGTIAFRLANGYAALRDALVSENVRFQRKALNLMHYLLHENTSDCNAVCELGFCRLMVHLASSEDADVREAALRGLLEIAKHRADGPSGRVVEDDEKVRKVLQDRIRDISSMSAEDIGAAREERQLIDSLWSICYNEPSSLREKGLLVLPREDLMLLASILNLLLELGLLIRLLIKLLIKKRNNSFATWFKSFPQSQLTSGIVLVPGRVLTEINRYNMYHYFDHLFYYQISWLILYIP